MLTDVQPTITLTARDLMSREVISVPEQMPLREAARLLLLHQISGMPVIEAGGVCIGVISTTDILRWASQRTNTSNPTDLERPLSCPFQIEDRVTNGTERTLCALPFDACPIQRKEWRADGGHDVICSHPHSVLADWQVVEMEQLPTEWNLQVTPTLYVLDHNGVIRYKWRGRPDEKEMIAAIQKLVKEADENQKKEGCR